MDLEQTKEEYTLPLRGYPEHQESPQCVYSVDNGTLPSNMRTVFLTKAHFTREYRKSGVCYHVCCFYGKDSNRKKKLWLIAVSILSVMALISCLSVWQILKTKSQKESIQKWDVAEEEFSETAESNQQRPIINQLNLQSKDFEGRIFERTPCRKMCWDFSAFKFKSRCLDGFCTCEGFGYHPETCLPDVAGCQIRAGDVPYARLSLNNQKPSMYSCEQRGSEEEQIFVISVFGKTESDFIVVEVNNSAEGEKVTLVLSSYQNVKWILKAENGAQINNIILIYTLNTGESDIVLEGFPSAVSPEVTLLKRKTGYGDDREGDHTVELLQTITEEIGQITSFIGSKYADFFSLNLDYFSSKS